jgi:hypothetical protein
MKSILFMEFVAVFQDPRALYNSSEGECLFLLYTIDLTGAVISYVYY